MGIVRSYAFRAHCDTCGENFEDDADPMGVTFTTEMQDELVFHLREHGWLICRETNTVECPDCIEENDDDDDDDDDDDEFQVWESAPSSATPDTFEQ